MIRRALFILFLYAVLVWIIAAIWYSGDLGMLIHQALIWTAVGVASLMLWLILEWAIGSFRVRRAQRAAKPTKQDTAPKPRNEDDAALASLLREADERLAQVPVIAG